MKTTTTNHQQPTTGNQGTTTGHQGNDLLTYWDNVIDRANKESARALFNVLICLTLGTGLLLSVLIASLLF